MQRSGLPFLLHSDRCLFLAFALSSIYESGSQHPQFPEPRHVCSGTRDVIAARGENQQGMSLVDEDNEHLSRTDLALAEKRNLSVSHLSSCASDPKKRAPQFLVPAVYPRMPATAEACANLLCGVNMYTGCENTG